MATLVLGLAGGLLGNALFGATAFTVFGQAVSGFAIGATLGSLAGTFIDAKLFMPKQEGPRLQDLSLMASTEGSPMPRVRGAMRVSPQMIWATRFKEEASTEEVGGSAPPGTVEVTTYNYFASFALALGEGPIAGIGSVWFDGKFTKIDDFSTRLYLGTEIQDPDPLIVAKEGEDGAPAFRGTAYIVFENLPLEKYGNRLPQITIEVIGDTGGSVPLSDVVEDICDGLDVSVDASALTGTVTGYMSSGPTTARAEIEALAQAYLFDGRERRGVMVFEPKAGRMPVASLTRDDLVAGDEGDYKRVRGQETELPRELSLRFTEKATDYQSRQVRSSRLRGTADGSASVELPVEMSTVRAQGIADALLIETHIARETISAALPPSMLAIEPGDVVTVTAGGRSIDYRLTSIGLDPARPIQGSAFAASTYDLVDGPDVDRPVWRPYDPVAPDAVAFLDLPVIAPDAKPWAPYVAATSSPWSRVAVLREGAPDVILGAPAIIGTLAAALPAGPVGVWDRGSAILVDVPEGRVLSSRTELAVLNQSSAGAVKTADGWEIVQWRDAELVSANRYRLTHLLRGQLGTDAVMAVSVPFGATFVVLDPVAVRQTNLPQSLRTAPQLWRYGPAALPASNVLYASQTLAFEGVGYRPYAPVHLRARRVFPSTDVTVTWVRRTRIGGDDWEQTEVPLNEESESYTVDVMSGSSVLRSVTVDAPTWVYAAADQIADHGSAPTSLSLRVRQNSSVWGAGPPVSAVIALPL